MELQIIVIFTISVYKIFNFHRVFCFLKKWTKINVQKLEIRKTL